jgi:hypothetical protein
VLLDIFTQWYIITGTTHRALKMKSESRRFAAAWRSRVSGPNQQR